MVKMIRRKTKDESLREGEKQILEAIAVGDPLEKTLTRTVLLIESHADGMIGSILLLSDDERHVRHGAAPHLPAGYIQAIDGSPIGPRAGCCGTAMHRRKTVIVSDIQTDPLWRDYRGLAEKFGLRACWSTPILSHSGKMLGSFAMYYREPRKPRPDELRLTAAAARLISLALERERAEEELRRRNRQIHELAGRLISAQEEERRRISRELHDDLIQRIAALALNLSLLDRTTKAPGQSQARGIKAIQRQVSDLERIVRNLSHQLHPAILEHLGLVVALRSFTEEFSRLEKIKVSLTIKNVETPVCREIGLCAYRVVQETLRNIVKHSGARKAAIRLAVEDSHLVLTVSDHGKGFDLNRSRGRGLGLLSIEERVRHCRGTVQITSRPNRGTVVLVRFPLTIDQTPSSV